MLCRLCSGLKKGAKQREEKRRGKRPSPQTRPFSRQNSSDPASSVLPLLSRSVASAARVLTFPDRGEERRCTAALPYSRRSSGERGREWRGERDVEGSSGKVTVASLPPLADCLVFYNAPGASKGREIEGEILNDAHTTRQERNAAAMRAARQERWPRLRSSLAPFEVYSGETAPTILACRRSAHPPPPRCALWRQRWRLCCGNRRGAMRRSRLLRL